MPVCRQRNDGGARLIAIFPKIHRRQKAVKACFCCWRSVVSPQKLSYKTLTALASSQKHSLFAGQNLTYRLNRMPLFFHPPAAMSLARPVLLNPAAAVSRPASPHPRLSAVAFRLSFACNKVLPTMA